MEEHFKHNTMHLNAQSDLVLCHKDVYMSEEMREIAKSFIKGINVASIKLSKHLLDTICNNIDGDSHQYTDEDISTAIKIAIRTIDTLNIFELGWKRLDDGNFQLQKVCFRVPLDSTDDICLVIFKRNNEYTVATAWINKKDDDHKVNFNPNRYYRPKVKKVILKKSTEPKKFEEPKKPDVSETPKRVVKIKRKRPDFSEKDFEEVYNLDKS